MPNQNPQPIEPNNQTLQAAPSALSPVAPVPQSKSSGARKVFKIIGIIFGVLAILLILYLGLGFYLLSHDKTASQQTTSSQNNLISNMSNITPLTAEKIKSLKSTSNNPAGDYFGGSSDEQKQIVGAFVADNSKSDSTYLYIAANTAFQIGDIKDAGFLFFAAQIRKSFDYKRYGLGDADGNNIQTYLGFLNQTVGDSVNPAILRQPQEFSQAIDMLDQWQAVPADDALYDQKDYGSPVIPKEGWPAVADQVKNDFMDNYGRKMQTFLNNPKNAEALFFVQDYNFGKIPHTPENDQKYQQDKAIVDAGLK